MRLIPLLSAALITALTGTAAAADTGPMLPTGQRLTPHAAHGAVFQTLNPNLPSLPAFTAGQASAAALSPDGKTLLILTSGYNRNTGANGKRVAEESNEYVFVYGLGGAAPVKRQVLQVPNTFLGIAWAPDGKRFYVSAGVDDAVLEYAAGAKGYHAARRFPLGHAEGLGVDVKPEAAGVAVSPDGRRLLAANLQNDSVSLIDLVAGKVLQEIDLRPGKADPSRHGVPGGSYPRAIVWAGPGRALVTSERDREIIALAISPAGATISQRVKTDGQPTALLAGRHGEVYATLDNTDSVIAIDPVTLKIAARASTLGVASQMAGKHFQGGANSNALALSRDGKTLYVSNGGENAVAVLAVNSRVANRQLHASLKVTGMVPTGWYPTGVVATGGKLYVVNGKSDPGPNPGWCRNTLSIKPEDSVACRATNSYGWQLEKAGFLAMPAPKGPELARLTRQVGLNVGFIPDPAADRDEATLAAIRQRIKHVIYIVKENRTYDQVLGDLEVGDGDPKLAVFDRAITPNLHAIARQFVDLDHLFASGESSNTGWNWTTAARTNDFTEHEAPVNYAGRGLQYDQEGENRNLNVAITPHAARKRAKAATPDDDDILPGTADVAALDGPDAGEEGQGYVWNSALRAGLSVRNYGFYGDLSRYNPKAADNIPLERDPAAKSLQVFYAAKPELAPVTDPYFRGFDQAFPDYWRFQEWKREFDAYAAKGDLPALTLLRLAHDHTGDFARGIDGINTVEAEVADNDYAVGLVAQTIAESRFAKDTLIFVIEDDAQDGPDHVSSRRTTAYVVGPYIRQHAVVATPYTTVNFVRTIEDVLGLQPMAMNDALARPMADIFDLSQAAWSFKAAPSEVLRQQTKLPLPARTAEADAPPPVCRAPRDAAYWAKAMAGLNFAEEDRLDTPRYNRLLWTGMTGKAALPKPRRGDLSRNRAALLARSGCP